MKKHRIYKKVDSWCYTSSRRHTRTKIKRNRNKVIRRIDKENVEKEILYW